MPYVAPEVVQRVKQIDLLTYLKNYEPYEAGAFLREHLYHQNPRQFEDFQWKMEGGGAGGSVVGAHWTI